MLTEEQIKKYREFSTKLESVYANDPAQLAVVEAAVKGFDVLCENNGGTAATGDVDVFHKKDHDFGNNAFAQAANNATDVFKQEGVVPLGPSEIVSMQKNLLRWGLSNPVECQSWINKNLAPVIKNAAALQFRKDNLTDDNDWQKWFNEQTRAKSEDEIAEEARQAEIEKQKARQAAADEAMKAGEEEKKARDAEVKRQGFENKAKAIDDKEAELNKENERAKELGIPVSIYKDNKLGLLDQLKRRYYKWRAGIKEAVEKGDMAMVEAIENEIKMYRTVLEGLNIDVSSVFG